MSDPRFAKFRPEAVAYMLEGREAHGPAFVPEPPGLRTGYQACLVLAFGIALVALVGRVGDDAVGQGVVHQPSRRLVAARTDGHVEQVHVRVGQGVKAGDVMVSLDRREQMALVRRHQREQEALLAKILVVPSDDEARADLARVNADLEAAKLRLDARTLRSPVDGRVTDLAVHVGQPVTQGQRLAWVDPGTAGHILVAAVPGDYRPHLRAGQPVRVEFAGFPDAVQSLVTAEVGGLVMAPEEAARILGRGTAAVQLHGPQTQVVVKLPPHFESRGQQIELYDGMQAKVMVQARRERVIEALIPWTKKAGL